MRNWNAVPHALKQETRIAVDASRGRLCLPLLIVVGRERPDALLALGRVDPDDPMDAVSELAAIARAFRPTRAMAALVVPQSETWRTGMLVCVDVTAVADGQVEFSRGWVWGRLGRHVMWAGSEVQTWQPVTSLLPMVARMTVAPWPTDHPRELYDHRVLREMVEESGHRIRLARRQPLRSYSARK